MKVKKILSKAALMLSVVGVAASVFFCPAASIPSQAAGLPGIVSPYSDIIRYRYAVFGGNKVYRRLYNHSTREWIGDWEFVCYVNT